MQAQLALFNRRFMQRFRLSKSALCALLLYGASISCAPGPAGHAVMPQAVAPVPPPPVEIIFYPNKGQSPQQQDRDKYECYLWAVNESGFDPSLPLLAPHQRIDVVPQPPAGTDTAVGAVTGAVIGAIVSSPHHTGEGAAIGAVAGAVLGSISDASRQQEARLLEERYNRQSVRQNALLEYQVSTYRRAMTACLEGRGYTVIWER